MMGRALSLAAAGFLGCLVASPGQAQQNLDAGKSAAQIFNGNCGACHRSAKGLLKSVSPSSLPEFLREHYTTGSEMAQALSAYLTSNRAGAADREAPSGARGGKPQERATIRPDAPIGNAAEGSEQAKPDGKPARAAASKPDDPGANPTDAGKRRQRRGADAPDQAAGEADAGAKPRQARRGKRGEPAVTSAQPAQGAAPKPETPAPKDASTPKDAERTIDARVPVPEPVVLPPPTAADVKPVEAKSADKPVEAKPAETRPEAPAATAEKPATEKLATEKPAIEKPAEAAHAGTPGTDISAAPDGAPAPPISR